MGECCGKKLIECVRERETERKKLTLRTKLPVIWIRSGATLMSQTREREANNSRTRDGLMRVSYIN